MKHGNEYFRLAALLAALLSTAPFASAEIMQFPGDTESVTLTRILAVDKDQEAAAEMKLAEDMARDAVRAVIDRIVKRASRNNLRENYETIHDEIVAEYRNYIRWPEERLKTAYGPWSHSLGIFKTQRELTMEIRFVVKRDAMVRKLIQEDLSVGDFMRWKVYVEPYWVIAKPINPELVDICLANTRKSLIAEKFQILDFSKIQSKIQVALERDATRIKESEQDELDRFNELYRYTRPSNYVKGLEILSEYARLLVGVTIRDFSEQNGFLSLHLSLEAYRITPVERKWIGVVDEHSEPIPVYNATWRSKSMLVEQTAQKAAQNLSLQIRRFILDDKSREEKERRTPRTWVVKFTGFTSREVQKMKLAIKEQARKGGPSALWKVMEGDDMQRDQIPIEYVGLRSDLADALSQLLEGGGFFVSAPDYMSEKDEITFRKETK